MQRIVVVVVGRTFEDSRMIVVADESSYDLSFGYSWVVIADGIVGGNSKIC